MKMHLFLFKNLRWEQKCFGDRIFAWALASKCLKCNTYKGRRETEKERLWIVKVDYLSNIFGKNVKVKIKKINIVYI